MSIATKRLAPALLTLGALLVARVPCPAQDGTSAPLAERLAADFGAVVSRVYGTPVLQLSPDARAARSQTLDAIWSIVEGDPPTYLPGLRGALADDRAPPFFRFDGARLLMRISDRSEDLDLAARALARCDLAEVDHGIYLLSVHELSTRGAQTLDAALHVLDAPDFSAALEDAGLRMDGPDALGAMLAPADVQLWQTGVMSRLAAGGDDPRRGRALVLLLWHAATPEAEALLEVIADDEARDPVVRQEAHQRLAMNTQGRELDAATLAAHEEHVRVNVLPLIEARDFRRARREILTSISQQRLHGYHFLTGLMLAGSELLPLAGPDGGPVRPLVAAETLRGEPGPWSVEHVLAVARQRSPVAHLTGQGSDALADLVARGPAVATPILVQVVDAHWEDAGLLRGQVVSALAVLAHTDPRAERALLGIAGDAGFLFTHEPSYWERAVNALWGLGHEARAVAAVEAAYDAGQGTQREVVARYVLRSTPAPARFTDLALRMLADDEGSIRARGAEILIGIDSDARAAVFPTLLELLVDARAAGEQGRSDVFATYLLGVFVQDDPEHTMDDVQTLFEATVDLDPQARLERFDVGLIGQEAAAARRLAAGGEPSSDPTVRALAEWIARAP